MTQRKYLIMFILFLLVAAVGIGGFLFWDMRASKDVVGVSDFDAAIQVAAEDSNPEADFADFGVEDIDPDYEPTAEDGLDDELAEIDYLLEELQDNDFSDFNESF